jgi:hypothetical protein
MVMIRAIGWVIRVMKVNSFTMYNWDKNLNCEHFYT